MTDVDHSGLGAAYLRSHSDTPIQHPAGASCGYCAPPTPDRLTQAVARSLFAAQLAAIEDEMEREHYRMAGNFRAAYAGVAEFRGALSEYGFAISPAPAEPTLDVAWREAGDDLSDEQRLLLLAAWFDMWDRPETDRQAILDDRRNPARNDVQRDLRRIAARLRGPA